MTWQVPRVWEGGDVWIIGGGPSMTKQFEIPDEVVKGVLSGTSPASVYSPYMKGIHNKHIIGINVSYLLGDWVDMVFFGDNGFFNSHKERLALFPGLKITCVTEVAKVGWVKFLARDGKGRGLSENPKMVCWNNNSGAAAMSVAANAGAKRIILLGFDMKLNDKNFQHWHNMYGKGDSVDIKRLQRLPFDKHLRGFASIAQDARKRGIEVINCSAESKITEFPKMSIKDLL
jgi:hypothetical protein